MKILLFGSRGMLGTDLGGQLKKFSKELIEVDKEEVDITNKLAVIKTIKETAPNIIINATGFTDVDGAELNKETAFKLNSEAVSFLVSGAEIVDAKLIHFSTEMVFSGDNKYGYNETANPKPINIYGESKLAGERFLLSYDKGYLIRTSWLYGKSPQRGKPRGMNFIETIIKLASEKAEVKVVNDQFGKLTYTKDLAEAVVNLLKGDYRPGIYHLVNEGVCSWYDIAEEVWRIKSFKTPLLPIISAEYPTAAQRPKWGVLINTKFPSLREWPEALREYLLL